MSTQKILTRIAQKHDLEVRWLSNPNFVPMQGELIIYDAEVDTEGNTLDLPVDRVEPYTYERLKIGDGITAVNDLPFCVQQSDFSQNNSSAPDYIKNRTHWAEEPVITTEVLLPEDTIAFEGCLSEVELPLTFTENAEYIVVWDGVAYTVITEKVNVDGLDFIVFGNPALLALEENAESNGQPFAGAYVCLYQSLIFVSDDFESTSHTVGITRTITTQEIHKLDDKYINTEWLPQKTIVSTVGLVETTATITFDGFYVPSESYDLNALLASDYYDVLWNGETYRCNLNNYNGYYFIGNASIIFETVPDTGEPFVFLMLAVFDAVAAITAEETEATFSITCHNRVAASTLPIEYLPEQLRFGYEHEAEIHKEAITWDGDTAGRVTLDGLSTSSTSKYFYQVSSSTPDLEAALNGGTITLVDINGLNTFSFDAAMVSSTEYLYVVGSYIFVFSGDAQPAGIYFYNDGSAYVSSFSINNYTFVEKEIQIKTVDPKYLPAGIGSGLPEVTTSDDGKSVSVVDGEWQVKQLSYNDLSDKPTLGTIASKSTVSKTDLSSNVQTSLNKADTALQSYTETDPTVPAWAKATTKPSYTKSEIGLGNVENVKQYSASNPPPYPVTKVNNKTGVVSLSASDVGALPNTTTIPNSLSDLSDDSMHRTVTDSEKAVWNAKSNFSGDYNNLTNKPAYAGAASAGGAATSANKLATARTISLSGAVSGYASFDGSTDVNITTAHAQHISNKASGTYYYKLGTMVADGSSNYGNITISGRLGGWEQSNSANFDIMMLNRSSARDGNTITATVSASGMVAEALTKCDIVVYKQADTSEIVYLKLNGYWLYDFDWSVYQHSISYSATNVTPTGSLVWSLSAAPKTILDTSGNFYINGSKAATMSQVNDAIEAAIGAAIAASY